MQVCPTCVVSRGEDLILFVVMFSNQLPQSLSHQTFITDRGQTNQSSAAVWYSGRFGVEHTCRCFLILMSLS